MRIICLLYVLTLSLLGLGCTDTALIVDVGNIPPSATELRAVVRLGSQQSIDTPRYAFAAGRGTYSIGLNLKGQTSGAAQITIGAFLNGCLLATGRLEIPDITMAPSQSSINLDAPSSDVSDTSCADVQLLLVSATTLRNPATGENLLEISGFGFAPNAQVLLDYSTRAATGYRSVDPRSFQVDLPKLIPPVDHQLHVQVLQPDGSSATGDFAVSIPVFDGKQPTLYPKSASDPFLLLGPVLADDLDGDGAVDLVASANGEAFDSGFLQIYFNDGTGNFPVSRTVQMNAEVRDLAALKLRSGKLHDLAVTVCRTPFQFPKTSYSRCNLVILPQLTARVFNQQLLSRDGSETNGQHAALVTGDFSGDGVWDVVVITNSAVTPFSPAKISGLQSMIKLYDGSSLSVNNFNVLASKLLTAPAVALAVDQLRPVPNGLLDLAIAEYTASGAGQIELYLNPGNGRFDMATPSLIPLAGRPGKLTTGDYDLDGHPDLAVALYQTSKGTPGSSINVFLRRSLLWSQQIITTGLAPLGIVTIDLLSDGSPDLLITNSRSGLQSAQLGLLFNQNAGQFSASAPTSIPLPTTTDANIAVADFNGDLHQDLALANYGISGQAGTHVGSLSLLFGL